MTQYVRFENPEDLEWLVTVVSNAVYKVRKNISAYNEIAPKVERCADTLAAPLSLDDVAALLDGDISDAERVREEIKASRKRRSAEEVAAAKKAALCKDHINYQAKRRPSTDCKGCWSAYKKLEPNKYQAALRSFKAAQRKKEA